MSEALMHQVIRLDRRVQRLEAVIFGVAKMLDDRRHAAQGTDPLAARMVEALLAAAEEQ